MQVTKAAASRLFAILLAHIVLWLCLISSFAKTGEATTSNDGGVICQANTDDDDGVCQTSANDYATPLDGDDDDALCQVNNSQTSLAVQMVNFSSPKGSASLEKMRRILSRHGHFYLDLGGSQGVFDSVAENLATMLEGYGLERVVRSLSSPEEEDVLVVQSLFSKWKDDQGTLYLERANTSVVVIQTEQICCSPYGQRALPYFKACHHARNCVIWEYSDLNYKWLQRHTLADSTLLLPTLHQNRLDPYLPPKAAKDIKPLADRPIDVVFFGVMTERRTKITTQIRAMAAGRWKNIVLQEVENSGSKLAYMAEHYINAKICLIVHSFQGSTPGEYHRLSELAKSGCVPVIETFGDTFGVDVYSQCGGVVFSELAKIPFAIQNVLNHIETYDATLAKRVQWWENRIQWGQLLRVILDDSTTE